jgi:DNA-binding MarR family transcriptional regulator
MRQRFECKTRAAQDALAILISVGWLERADDETDRRRKIYVVTEKGGRISKSSTAAETGGGRGGFTHERQHGRGDD